MRALLGTTSLVAFVLIAPTSASAQLTEALAPASAPAKVVPPPPSVTISGYVEGFYQLNFNWPSNLITAYRGFDNHSSSFTIENAVVDVTGHQGPVFARVALQVGSAPASYYLAEPTIPAQGGVGPNGPALWQFVQQAILGYRVLVGRGLLTEAGIFLSPIGVEPLAIKDQWNWSHSNLFFALPYYHAGVRATYALSDTLTATYYLVNGWNDIVNVNPYPCMAGVVGWVPREGLSTTLLYFGGVERPSGSPEGQPWRNLFDATARLAATDWLGFQLEATTGWEHNTFGTSSWTAAAGYVRVRPWRELYVAGRADYFHESVATNASGMASRMFFPGSNVSEETATLAYEPADGFSLRLEYRHDTADAPMYYRGQLPMSMMSSPATPNARSQNTLTLGAVAWF
jgi:hypothetical protein